MRRLKYFSPIDRYNDNHTQETYEDREWENVYRKRWRHDKVIRSTHGVNCTGSCSWNIYVKDGIVTWEGQELNYPTTDYDMPDFEPRGCPRGASFSWYIYSPLRVKYPYVRGVLWNMWQEELQNNESPLEAWKSIVENREKARTYKQARGKGGFIRANWDEVLQLVSASLLYTVMKYGEPKCWLFTNSSYVDVKSCFAGSRFMQLMGECDA